MIFKNKLALEASAGSGKTFSLTVRYIALLLYDSKPNNILALTFTKKAANEMKARIFKTLQNLEKKEHENELKELSDLLKFTKSEILEKKEKITENFLDANIKISTIDAFFTQILRKFSLHFGLLPDFTNENKILNSKLEERFIKTAQVKNAYNSLVYFASMSNINFNNFFDFFLFLYEKDSEIDDFRYERITFPNDSKVLDIAKKIKEYLEINGASSTAMSQFDVEILDELLSKNFWERDTLNYRVFAKVYTEYLDELFINLKRELRSYYIQKEKFWLGELFYLYHIYKDSRINEIKRNSELAFIDTTNIVYTLLSRYIDKDFLYFRLDADMEHLLIDEFQDTNIVQFQILKPLIEEIVSGIGVKDFKSFFYVGDKKQSIYRFRGGAKVLFDYVAHSFDIDVDSLSKNYRSSKNIVEFVNDTFEPLIEAYERQCPIKEDGFVEVCTSEELLEDIKNKVDYLLKNGVNKDNIAILCITNKDADTIKEYLQESFKDLKVNTESNLKLIHSQNVKKIIEFLKYLYFKDELYGRNFQTLIGQSFNTLPEIINFDINEEPLELANRCIKEFKIDAYDLDIVRFLEIVANFSDLEKLLFSLENLSLNSIKKDNEGIKILTIHKSKGLEFDTVMVVDRVGGKNNQTDFLLFDYEDITLKNIFLNMIKREFVDEEFKIAKDNERLLSNEDTLNQQYVAFTRAMHNLFVIRKEKNSYFDNLDIEDIKIGKLLGSKTKGSLKNNQLLVYESRYFGRQNVQTQKDNVEGSYQNIYFGLALHFTLEMMNSFDTDELIKALQFAKNKFSYVLDEEAFISIQKRVTSLIDDEVFLKILNSGAIYKEQPFMYNQKRGQVDLLIENPNMIYIIDYKTSPYLKDEHIKQVLEYKEAFKTIKNIDVKALLCYLYEDGVEKIEV